jgi:hypothetical protein
MITVAISVLLAAAITVSVRIVMENLDGAGTGGNGIFITSGPSVQIFNSVVRHFQFGIIHSGSTNSNLLVEDTIASDNSEDGIVVAPIGGGSVGATLSRITANNNQFGVASSLSDWGLISMCQKFCRGLSG